MVLIVQWNPFLGTPRFKKHLHLGDPGQGRSVGSGKTAVKVFDNGRESPWNATPNEPVPVRVIRMLVYDITCAQSEANMYCAAFVIFLYEGVYL